MAKYTSPLHQALGRVSSGFYVVTVSHKGAETAMLASWVQQASFEPPMLTVAVAKERGIHPMLDAGAKIVVQPLAAGDKAPLVHFGKGFKPGENAFEGVEVDRALASAPVLKGAIAWMECELRGHTDGGGDHTVYLFEVKAGGVLHEDAEPAVHTRHTSQHY